MASYGTETLNGWILKFIPYVKASENEPAIGRNPLLEPRDIRGAIDPFWPKILGEKIAKAKIGSCTSKMLPSGLSWAPVKCVHRATGQTEEVDLIAGFLGVTQSSEDLSLRAMTGWAFCEGSSIDKQIAKLRLQHEVLPPVGMNPLEMTLKVFQAGLAGDVWRFYSETDGAVLTFQDSRVSCRVLPLAEIGPVWNVSAVQKELNALHKAKRLSVQELKEQQDFNWEYGRFLRIAQLSDGTWYVLGPYPKVWAPVPQRGGQSLASKEGDPEVVFHWAGARNPASFTFAAPSFSDWLTSLCER
jgi:hypothetical protein